MTTRGGVSKAQKGLHLNEDIYAGMNVVLRRPYQTLRIHAMWKGRDLGFGSILNFTTKIEQGWVSKCFQESISIWVHNFHWIGSCHFTMHIQGFI